MSQVLGLFARGFESLRDRHEAREFLKPGSNNFTAHDPLPGAKSLLFMRFRELKGLHGLAGRPQHILIAAHSYLVNRNQPLQFFMPVEDEDDLCRVGRGAGVLLDHEESAVRGDIKGVKRGSSEYPLLGERPTLPVEERPRALRLLFSDHQ